MKSTKLPKAPQSSQWSLLKTARFLPFFATQFLGACNDNIFKNSLILMITYSFYARHLGVSSGSEISTAVVNKWVNISAMLFILPFFLFSAFAGQFADKYDKQKIITYVKLLEVIIMIVASLAFYLDQFYLLIVMLFFMGAQSAFFGPAKYAIIPQQLKQHELVGGNSLIEMGTFLAILVGFIGANILVQADYPPMGISLVVLSLACLGFLTSRKIPSAPSFCPDMPIEWNPFVQIPRVLKYACRDKVVFYSIIGVSWFWFLGAAYLTQLPIYTKEALSGSTNVVTLLLCVFSIGIATGSLMCERLSSHHVEIGLVPIGLLGLTLFGFDLYLASSFESVYPLRSVSTFLELGAAWRVLVDIMLIGVFGGIYIVPLFAIIQARTKKDILAQVISANNIMNALAMVASAALGALALGVWGCSVKVFFALLVFLNVIVGAFLFSRLPLYLVSAKRLLLSAIGRGA